MSTTHNPAGINQHGLPILTRHPELKDILQGYVNQRMNQETILLRLKKDHGIALSLRTLQRAMRALSITSTRRYRTSEDEWAVAIVQKLHDDPLGRWGYRKVQEKLALEGVHIPRQFVESFMRTRDADAGNARNPNSKKVHRKGLWSTGPNEEWGGDGHEKILRDMGIAVWGLVDKGTRLELGLWAVPNARLSYVPVALYLLTVKKHKGIPIQLLTDMGSETGPLSALQTTLRLHYRPALDVQEVPAHKFVKSVYNIVRERGWRPLFEAELENILVAWDSGQLQAGYHSEDALHRDLAIWIWARVVQARLDQFVVEINAHKIRKQKNIRLPSGGSRNDFYDFPERWGGTNMLISIDMEEIDLLLAEHVPDRLFQFATDEGEVLAGEIYDSLGQPVLEVSTAWGVFQQMVASAKA